MAETRSEVLLRSVAVYSMLVLAQLCLTSSLPAAGTSPPELSALRSSRENSSAKPMMTSTYVPASLSRHTLMTSLPVGWGRSVMGRSSSTPPHSDNQSPPLENQTPPLPLPPSGILLPPPLLLLPPENQSPSLTPSSPPPENNTPPPPPPPPENNTPPPPPPEDVSPPPLTSPPPPPPPPPPENDSPPPPSPENDSPPPENVAPPPEINTSPPPWPPPDNLLPLLPEYAYSYWYDQDPEPDPACDQWSTVYDAQLTSQGPDHDHDHDHDHDFPFNVHSQTNETVFWQQAADAYFAYCGRGCNSSELYFCFTDHACLSCHCDPVCVVYGDCCPSEYPSLHPSVYPSPYTPQHPPSLGYSHPLHPFVNCSRTSFGGATSNTNYTISASIMITGCPSHSVVDETLRRQCESGMTSRWDLTQPVTSRDSLLTYRNRYCARCNSESDVSLLPWDVKIHVGNAAFLAKATSSEEVYQLVMEGDDNELYYEPPADVKPYVRSCSEESMVSRCNVTGYWSRHDVMVDRACQLMMAPISTNLGMFRNPFCYLCNTWLNWTQVLEEQVDYDEPPGVFGQDGASLLLLLDFTDSDDDDDDYDDNYGLAEASRNCSSGQFFHPVTKNCTDLICALGKRHKHVNDPTCKSSPKVTNLYGLELCLQEKTNETLVELINWTDRLIELSYRLYDAVSSDPVFWAVELAEVDLFRFHASGDGPPDLYRQLHVFKFFQNRPVDRDLVDEAMVANVTFLLDVIRGALGNKSLQLSPTCDPKVFQRLWSKNDNSTQGEIMQECTGNNSTQGEMKLDSTPRDNSTHGEMIASCSRKYKPYFEYSDSGLLIQKVVFLPLSGPLVCPAVQLGQGEFRYDYASGELLVLSDGLSVVGRVQLPSFYITDVHSSVVCLAEYRELFQEPKEGDESQVVLHWMTLVSFIISLLFLFVSFVIYCLLSSLRSVAGINNLMLIVALFGAQLLLLLGTTLQIADWLCQVVGVATHYFWLAVALAQNVCTFHMFYTLSFPLASHAVMANPAAMTRKYVTYVTMTSAAFVVVTLLWQGVAEGGSGYGGRGCYIVKGAVKLSMFVVPLALTVVANVLMFLVTMLRLRSMQHVSSTRGKRSSLLMYTKLSVFTGLTWLLAFLDLAVRSVVLQYVFTIFQGLQGFFVFLAFLANRRVLDLLKERGAKGKRGGGTSISGRTASTKASSPSFKATSVSGGGGGGEGGGHDSSRGKEFADTCHADAEAVTAMID